MTVDEFVARVRARRAEAGRPDRIDNDAVYQIIDGLMAARRGGDADHAPAAA